MPLAHTIFLLEDLIRVIISYGIYLTSLCRVANVRHSQVILTIRATSYSVVNLKCSHIRIHVFVGRLTNFIKPYASYV